MTKYRKSLLSAAAALAITSTALSAQYLPLTTTANDFRWVLFGVAGLQNDGGTDATASGVFSVTPSTAANTITDPTNDALEISGFTIGGGNNARVKALTTAAAPVEVRMDTTGVTYDETEPFRTMYVTSVTDGAPEFAFTYKASLEGKELQYTINGGHAYKVTVNYTKTYDTPAVGTEITGSALVEGDILNSLTGTLSAVDYNFADNPPLSAQFDATQDRTAKTTETLRMYGYNALNSRWDIYDTRNTAGTNDFTTILPGKGYWGQLDVEGDQNASASLREAGLVLGTPAITTANYAAVGLADGWNLIAFDEVNSEIRAANTGLLLTMNTTTGGQMKIKDSSGNRSVTITFVGVNDSGIVVAKNINNAVERAKLLGTLPHTFDLRAYPTTGLQVALVSNKKFMVEDVAASNDIGAVTTMAGQLPLLPSTKAVPAAAVTDLYTTPATTSGGVMSVYGEYAMVIEPLVGAQTAQGVSATMSQSEVTTPTITSPAHTGVTAEITNAATVVLTAAAYAAGHTDLTGANGKATPLDLTMDGTAGHILLASKYPFTIRDKTFTRVYDFQVDSGGNSTVNIEGTSADVTGIAIDANASAAGGAAAAVVRINAAAGATIESMVPTADTTNVVVMTNGDSASAFKVVETTAFDNLRLTTLDDNSTKGSIKAVNSLAYLSKISTNNIIDLNVSTAILPAGDGNVTIRYQTVFDVNVTGSPITMLTGATLASLVTAVNTQLADANLTATASASGTDTIRFSGYDLNKAYQDANTTGLYVAGTPDLGYIAAVTGDLTSDLKYNVLKTPNYVMDGPLYTMKDSGMTLKALVTGTMNMVDGNVSWESIDLTRLPSQWFNSQDYDLFDTDAGAGYWAYLTSGAAANPIVINTPVISAPNYTHYFDKDTLTDGTHTTHNTFAATIYVQVDNLNSADGYASTRVTATIGGQTIELVDGTGSGAFSASLNANEATGISENSPYEIIVAVADGLGYHKTQSFAGVFDNVKPAAPTVTMANGLLNISSADTNVHGFYVFNATIPEVDTNASKVAYLSEGGAVGIVCEGLNPVSWNTAAGGLNVVAIDQTGIIETANASDASSVAFMPILKDRVLITDSSDGGDLTGTTDAYNYSTGCANLGLIAPKTGVALAAITSDKTVKLAYASLGEELVTAVPITFYVKEPVSGDIAKISYPPSYGSTTAFIQIGGLVYGVLLPASDAAIIGLTGGESSASPYDLSTNAAVSLIKTGISL